MNKTTGLLLSCCVLFAGVSMLAAQETTPPPKVLSITREYLKPGKGGAAHERAEGAFIQAMTRAKWPTHYFALTAVTGRPRVLFLTGYESFEAWEKDVLGEQKNSALSSALDRASVTDGELLSDYDSTALVYSEDYSLRGPVDIAHMRYFEISLYRVRPGHDADWGNIVKMVKAAYEKVPEAHWAAYHAEYGQEGNTYVIFTPLKSASEIDQSFAQDKQFMTNMGEDGMKKFGELMSSSIEFSQHNLFVINPSMSYPPEKWIQTDPDFWKPKASAMAKKPAQ
jgi:hypothetical protein